MIGVVQFRNTSLDVEQSNPVNKDFENLINSDDDELFGAFPEWFAQENDCQSRTGNNMLAIKKLNVKQTDRVENLLSKI